jgi:cytochrome c oxidase subunit 2
MWQTLPLWPARASTIANRTDALMIFMISVCGFFTVMIFILIFIFALKYRRGRHPVATQIEGSNALEATWTLIPFGVFIIMFVWGASIYMVEARPPADALEVFVVGKQWMWKFEHPEGQREIDQLHVPLGRDVRLTMISQDVIHSFFVPEFRIKQDVLPGRYTTAWFHSTVPGRYHLFCTQYCGTMHSGMIGEVVVMEPAAYQAWLSGGSAEGSLASTGQKMFQQLGCATCHRFDTQGRGPNLVGLYGKPVLLEDGRTVVADDNYIRESILSPGAKVVAGFRPIMPTFQGIVNEEQVLSLIAYIKSLAQPEQREPVSNRPAVPAHPAPAPAAAAPKPSR